MMQAFRNAAKPVIIVLTVSFFAWLVFDLSGLGTGGTSVLARTTVGKVNGTSVDIRSFDQRVQNAIDEQQQRSSQNLGLDEVNALRDRVWEQVIQEILFAEQYEQHGIRVTADELADAIRTVPLPALQASPDLQTNGTFDLEKYRRWLASAAGQQVVPLLEMQYREEIMRAKLFRNVVADVFVSDAALWERYRDENEKVKVGLTRIDAHANVSDAAAPVTADEAKAYYTKNRESFRRPASAYLSYLYIPRVAESSDTAAALERARIIKSEIDGGAPFAEVAQRESADTISGRDGGDLGERAISDYDPAFGAALAKLPLKKVSDPVLSSFGYHIVQVESRNDKEKKAKARHILIPIEITGAHRDRLDAIADSLESLAAEKVDRAAIDTAARALGLTVRPVGPITPGSRVVVPEGQGKLVPDAGVWAFQAKPGEHSDVIEAANAFYVFRLDSVLDDAIPPFEQMAQEAERRARLDKKVQKAKELGEQLTKQAAASSLAQASRALGFEYNELPPFSRLTASLSSPSAIGAAFGLEKGKVSGVLGGDPSDTDKNIYVLQVLERTPADSAEFAKNLTTVRDQALQSARRTRVQQYVTMLRESAKVTDHRAEVYRTAAQRANQAGL